MAKTGRPPLTEARTQATKSLIELHREEHEALATKWLADKGWVEETETTSKWVNKPTEDEETDNA